MRQNKNITHLDAIECNGSGEGVPAFPQELNRLSPVKNKFLCSGLRGAAGNAAVPSINKSPASGSRLKLGQRAGCDVDGPIFKTVTGEAVATRCHLRTLYQRVPYSEVRTPRCLNSSCTKTDLMKYGFYSPGRMRTLLGNFLKNTTDLMEYGVKRLKGRSLTSLPKSLI